jgi:hypothetical protein
MKIELKTRAIPRDTEGDPCFRYLNDAHMTALPQPNTAGAFHVLGVFSMDEVVELVNRALYQLEYQHQAHKIRGKRIREQERAIRLKVKELFHVSWMKATPEQIKRAREEVGKV